jgi:hypothetical protein
MFLSRHNHNRSKIVTAPVVALLALILGGLLALGAGATQAQQANLPIGSTAATTAATGLYDTPASDGKLVATMPLNAQATVAGGPFNEGWYWLDYKGTKGYALGKTLVIVDSNYKPVPSVTPKPVSPYEGLWVGEMAKAGPVKSGPASNTSTVKSWWAGRRVILYQEVADSKGTAWYRVSDPPEAPMYVQASLVKKVFGVKYEDGNRFKNKWINVNLAQQVVVAYENGSPVKVTLASTGKASTPTNPGVQSIQWRTTSQRMRGGTPGVDYYDLPNVINVQYFNSTGEALHGAYWHDDFGHPHSHGCVNLSNPISKWFYDWAYVGMVVWVH